MKIVRRHEGVRMGEGWTETFEISDEALAKLAKLIAQILKEKENE